MSKLTIGMFYSVSFKEKSPLPFLRKVSAEKCADVLKKFALHKLVKPFIIPPYAKAGFSGKKRE
ncbi:hypothetical protein [Treponema phagedenis]|uniref:hypothetical protein n=1 Tax=Treponema phagedenis TaxID=162 RepID=UPI001583C842|nr:hypothetical protein [Treponema phagedenis]QKS93502.1 hypothetical protein HPJ96_13775 [Treponema phagedenis]